jgi:hypothetical protein
MQELQLSCRLLSGALSGILIACAGCAPAPIPPEKGMFVRGNVNFDNALAGTLPLGWIAGVTGTGTPRWSVEPDATAPSGTYVLKQSGEGTSPWCVESAVSFANGFVEVKFKPITGTEGQAGGVVWRWKDANNYYVARANVLENNVTIYHVVGGKPRSLGSVKTFVMANAWHTLRVEFRENQFTVFFDGPAALIAEDDQIKCVGAVGVWTHADSVTAFDDLSYGSK